MEGWTFSKVVPQSEGDCLPIKIQLYLYEVCELDSVNQSFRADFYMVCQWKGATPEKDENGGLTAWWPKFEVMNKKELDDASFSSMEYIEEEGIYKYTTRLLGVFKILGMVERLNTFPFDTQHLAVDISFWNKENEIALIVDSMQTSDPSYRNKELYISYFDNDREETINMAESIDLPEWELGREYSALRTFSHDYETTMFDRHPRFQWDIPIRRKYKYYFTKILSVAMISDVLCGMTFLIPAEMLDARLAISLTLFLALVAFQFVVTDSLPKTAQQTNVDKFFVTSYSFSAFTVIASIVLHILPYPPDVVQDIDWLLLAVYVLFNLIFGSRIFFKALQHGKEEWILEPHREREAVKRFFNPPLPEDIIIRDTKGMKVVLDR